MCTITLHPLHAYHLPGEHGQDGKPATKSDRRPPTDAALGLRVHLHRILEKGKKKKKSISGGSGITILNRVIMEDSPEEKIFELSLNVDERVHHMGM